MDDAADRTLGAVGPRLKQLRQRRGTTLAVLAAETGISTSTLSRLEAGLRRPTLEQLLPLARAHGVTLDQLVDAPPTGDPRVTPRPIACGDGRVPDEPSAPVAAATPPATLAATGQLPGARLTKLLRRRNRHRKIGLSHPSAGAGGS